MKKRFLSIIVALSLTLTILVGCGNNNDTEDPADNTQTEDVVETEKEEDTDKVEESDDSEEDDSVNEEQGPQQVFDYLPAVDENAQLDESEEADEEMGKEVYTIEDAKAEEVLDEYFDKLEADGWEILEDDRPDLVRATKDDHEAIVVAGQVKEDVKLTIVSK